MKNDWSALTMKYAPVIWLWPMTNTLIILVGWKDLTQRLPLENAKYLDYYKMAYRKRSLPHSLDCAFRELPR